MVFGKKEMHEYLFVLYLYILFKPLNNDLITDIVMWTPVAAHEGSSHFSYILWSFLQKYTRKGHVDLNCAVFWSFCCYFRKRANVSKSQQEKSVAHILSYPHSWTLKLRFCMRSTTECMFVDLAVVICMCMFQHPELVRFVICIHLFHCITKYIKNILI